MRERLATSQSLACASVVLHDAVEVESVTIYACFSFLIMPQAHRGFSALTPIGSLQDGDWHWLARALPNLQTLTLTRIVARGYDHWPAAMAQCSSLKELHLAGLTAPPLLNGQYLSRLQKLSWVSSRRSALPKGLANSPSLEMLTLGLKHIVDLGTLMTMPNLKEAMLVVLGNHDAGIAAIIADLQRRLGTTTVRWCCAHSRPDIMRSLR